MDELDRRASNHNRRIELFTLPVRPGPINDESSFGFSYALPSKRLPGSIFRRSVLNSQSQPMDNPIKPKFLHDP